MDFAVLDDVITSDNSDPEDQREKFREWYMAKLEPILNPNARIIFVGTRWRPSDYYGEIIEKLNNKEPPKGIGKLGFKILLYPCCNM